MKITEALLAEHVVFHNLFDQIERALPRLKTAAEVRSLAALLTEMLRIHTRVEDELLIEPLEHCFEQIGQRETFHEEHEQIDADLARSRQAKRIAEGKRLLLEAVLNCRKHFDKEERLVFPLAEEAFNHHTLMT
ncbi:MAG: hemerythrin domain-containing protein, partial [Verrucomicrobia bacterium]|nr:hemerythrin domain-containing protein [Verrucomicrobiota bacterium]